MGHVINVYKCEFLFNDMIIKTGDRLFFQQKRYDFSYDVYQDNLFLIWSLDIRH